ncbi:helix-turn-helix domain-containing protein [Haladaptatus sp. AB643]|uniref:helix-turn-helix domain-containing protein n=1 Tax=Haladaptatus sp. AB643 TaxID=2934174 RepID=UPI00209C0C6F|nr:helix-turn-helix domain-containing protein [Haladaptatus sp. AB643]MCO8243075.1 helix-turn-helix domain-containing protein [Haladaptatus sp. AB643]
MTEDSDVRAIAALLEDEYAHAILIHTSDRAMSAHELSDVCDASVSTVYRRIERLQEHELLTERLELDRDGHHYNTYTARLDRIEIRLEEGAFEIEVTYREENAADRFTDLFEGLR